jgi:hypothetical protein
MACPSSPIKEAPRLYAIATRQPSMLLMKSGLVLPFVWQGRLSTVLKTSSAAREGGRGDVGSRASGWMVKEWPCAIMLPEE